MKDAIAATPMVDNILGLTGPAATAAEKLVEHARAALSGLSGAELEERQYAAHAFAWMATYAEALSELDGWARKLESEGAFGEMEQLILQIGFGEYLSQLRGGIPMSQGEIARPQDVGIDEDAQRAFLTAEVATLAARGNTDAARARLAELIIASRGVASFGATGLDEDAEMIRDQFRRFADERVVPFAHEWHLKDELIPIELVNELAELGVFGLTIPEEYGGAGFGKTAMVVVSEELSRGYIGVGSLGTRSEIAAELIICGGTDAQKEHWLPKLATGEILPTAVFTEPDVGSDLGALKTRARRNGDTYILEGQKTWITHAGRADLMTVLARTNPETKDHKGLSMFLAEKTRGDDQTPFPDATIAGGEIEVLGYRGMKEYTLALDGHPVPAANLLGETEGQGFRQLMQTFESARIQTAARAIGVAQSALELGIAYAEERTAFGKKLSAFPRVYSKLAMMAVEIMVARQLTYFSARQKDEDKRCDLEAGMAKLLGARVAWAAADNALQIHGGNGFALEYPISRVLCDARILNIFEGAAEIQAQVIARRLLDTSRN